MRSPNLIQWGGNLLFGLLLFCFAADPANALFHLKDIAFVLLMGYNVVFLQAKWKRLVYFVIGLICIFIPWLIATARGEVLDEVFTFSLCKAMAPLCLLPWIHHYNVLKLARWPVFITGLVMIILFWSITFLPEAEGPIYAFMQTTNDTVLMAHRYFLGFKFFCMYHRSTASFLLIFAVAFYQCIRGGRRTWASVLVAVVLLNTFLVSGTRMTMLFPFLIMGLITFHFYHDRRYFNYVLYPLLGLAGMLFVVFVFMLAADASEPSNLVKFAHMQSYKDLFEENPIYLLTGQGPGARFYSLGFHRMTVQTEWTYLELVRYVGIFSLPILFIFIHPLVLLWRNRRSSELCYVLFFAYGVYLLVAGTNPLLLSSTGMFTLLLTYSFLEHIDEYKS